MSDFPGETILLIESTDSGINWMEPRDLSLEDALQGIDAETAPPHIATKHPEGASVLWCDNRVTTLPNDLPEEKLRAFLTASGGERVEQSVD